MANVTLKSANNGVVDIQRIESKKCKICKPELIFHKPDNRIVLAGLVEQEDDKYLMTSEYIKMMSHTDERGQVWLTSSV